MARQHERTLARKCAIQVLYTGVIRGKDASKLLEDGEILCMDDELSDYALSLVRGVEAHMREIDEQLESISENWTVERMPILDRTILRVAMYEMLHVEDVPISVSINEAVELAKEFGGEDESPRFVNGMLGRVAKQLEGETSE